MSSRIDKLNSMEYMELCTKLMELQKKLQALVGDDFNGYFKNWPGIYTPTHYGQALLDAISFHEDVPKLKKLISAEAFEEYMEGFKIITGSKRRDHIKLLLETCKKDLSKYDSWRRGEIKAKYDDDDSTDEETEWVVGINCKRDFHGILHRTPRPREMRFPGEEREMGFLLINKDIRDAELVSKGQCDKCIDSVASQAHYCANCLMYINARPCLFCKKKHPLASADGAGDVKITLCGTCGQQHNQGKFCSCDECNNELLPCDLHCHSKCKKHSLVKCYVCDWCVGCSFKRVACVCTTKTAEGISKAWKSAEGLKRKLDMIITSPCD